MTREIEDYQSWIVLSADILGNSAFHELFEEGDFMDLDNGDGTSTRALPEAGLSAVAKRAWGQLTASAANAEAKICCEFEFCKKLCQFGEYETAKALAAYFETGALGVGFGAVVFSDPSLLLPLVALLTFYLLKDICKCGSKSA